MTKAFIRVGEKHLPIVGIDRAVEGVGWADMRPVEAWPGGPHPGQIARMIADGYVISQTQSPLTIDDLRAMDKKRAERAKLRLAAALGALVAAGSPGLEPRFQNRRELVKRLFRRPTEVFTQEPIEPAWPVGTVRRTHKVRPDARYDKEPGGREETNVFDAGITPGGVVVMMACDAVLGDGLPKTMHETDQFGIALCAIASLHGVHVEFE